MLFASIDIGSNAVRLLFANVFETKGIVHVEKASLIRVPLRLGEDAFNNGMISEKRIENLVKTMTAFQLLLDVNEPADYIACATSAMREASNSQLIIEQIKKETGIEVSIIGGEEEAKIICATDNPSTGKKYALTMYIDVGGGSTEISAVKDHLLVDSTSFNLGTIRILDELVTGEEWDKLKAWLQQFRKQFGKIYLIGSGGNINKLEKIYSSQKNSTLSYDDLKRGSKKLKKMTLQQRIEELGMRPDRADVIIPAAEIFHTIMKTTKANFISVPRIGLADGLIHIVYKNYMEKEQNKELPVK